jgi:formylglycine-generating enzyme required for sulfatase activity
MSGLSSRLVLIIDEGTSQTWNGMTLTSYALSESEITQGDYVTVIGSNPAHDYGVGSNYPVYFVDWYDAVLFCNELSKMLGLQKVYNETTWDADFSKNGFFLPTEAQWEYAAGGPNHYTYSLGDTFDSTLYTFDQSNSQPVKSYPANGFGLHDMGGSVHEWCSDWWGGSYPYTGLTDPTGPASGTDRVLHSNMWEDDIESRFRCDFRGRLAPNLSRVGLGFRICAGGFSRW